jgi:hypothetical protein
VYATTSITGCNRSFHAELCTRWPSKSRKISRVAVGRECSAKLAAYG